jgi:alpha-galactosidase
MRFAIRSALCLLILFSVSAGPSLAQRSNRVALAPAPPMGWNSWDSYGLTINEQQFKSNVEYFAAHLKNFGWQYVVIDEGWYLQHPENAGKPAADAGCNLSSDGLYLPATNRFPSSSDARGFRPLAEYVHGLGLKFGIHIIRGIPRDAVRKNLPIAGSGFHAAEAADQSDLCAWNTDNFGIKANEAGQAYYNSVAKLYASWGVDFVKVDCISQPYKDEEIRMFSQALRATGKPIVLSLSPGPTPLAKREHLQQYAQMWRISDDFWDIWKRNADMAWPSSLLDAFRLTADWAPYVEPGHWPDADMLPLGHLGPVPGWGPVRDTRLTHDEQQTLLTLWSIFRSPLMLGASLPAMDDWTLRLLTNPEVIDVDQRSTQNHPVISTKDTVVWTAKPDAGPGYYVAAFNLADQPRTITYPWSSIGVTSAGLTDTLHHVRDLWKRQDIGPAPRLNVALAPHACVLYRITQ